MYKRQALNWDALAMSKICYGKYDVDFKLEIERYSESRLFPQFELGMQ